MSLSKFSFGGISSSVNWRLVLSVGAPIALATIGVYYYKRNEGAKGQGQTGQRRTAKELKEEGNRFFKLAKYDQALIAYNSAITILEKEKEKGEELKVEGEELSKGEESKEGEQLEQLYQNMAAVHEKLGSFSLVIQETTNALKLNPKYVKALHRRSRSYKLTGFLEEALEDITAVCILEGFQSPSSVQLADDILRELGVQEGIRLLKLRQPTPPSVHTVEAYLHGFWNCPISRLLRDASSSPAPSGHYACAVASLKLGDYEKTVECCSQEISSNGASVLEAYHLRGTLRFLYGYGEETLQDFNYVVENNAVAMETKATCLIKRACYYSLAEEHDKCQESFTKAEELWADNVDFWHHRGQVMLMRSELELALECMCKAVEVEPEFSVAVATKWYIQFKLASFTANFDEQTKAIREFQKLVKRFPTSTDVHSLYGQVLLETHSFEEAEIHFTKVLELEPKNASVLVHKAMSRFQRTMDPNDAIVLLKDALKIDDQNAFIYETLGTLHLQIGDLEGAREYISKALTLARSLQELTILSSLMQAATVQQKVKQKLNISAPTLYK